MIFFSYHSPSKDQSQSMTQQTKVNPERDFEHGAKWRAWRRQMGQDEVIMESIEFN
jgi:hypothetical protein